MKRQIFVATIASIVITASAFALAHQQPRATARQSPTTLGIGRVATPDEIKTIDIDVMPD